MANAWIYVGPAQYGLGQRWARMVPPNDNPHHVGGRVSLVDKLIDPSGRILPAGRRSMTLGDFLKTLRQPRGWREDSSGCLETLHGEEIDQ